MKPIQRLEWYLKHKKIKYTEVEKKTGLATSYLSKQINNQGSIGSDILEKICRAYPDLNAAWLITGLGHYEAVQNENAISTKPLLLKSDVDDKLKFINDLLLPDKEKLELCKLYAEKLLLQIGLLEKELEDCRNKINHL